MPSMSGKNDKPLSISFFFFLCLLSCFCHTRAETNGMFVFGSSLVDNGNNKFVTNSFSRADYMPYGIDFPLGTTGRFTNGKNVIDSVGELLRVPSFLPVSQDPATKGSKIVNGVDFASGGSGILDETGTGGNTVISLNQQIKNFEQVTLPELKTQLGSNASLSNYLFVVASGGNDCLSKYSRANQTIDVNLQDFTTNLTQTLSTQIQKLYSLGARKFVMVSVYPLGCSPFLKTTPSKACVQILDKVGKLFNSKMKSLVDVLRPKMPGSRLVYVNQYQIIMDILHDPTPKGFENTTSPCCEVASINGLSCNRGGSTCGDRRSYVFFDGLHHTEAVNEIIANKAFSSKLNTEAYPMNIAQLAKF